MSFRSAREKAKLSQAEVARALDISRSSVNAWDKGKGLPRGSRLLAVARLLGCPADEILRRD